MTTTPETPSTATRPRRPLGLQVVLVFHLVFLSLGAIWLYPLMLLVVSMSADSSAADAHAATARYIWLVVPQAAVLLLATIQVGRTRWGALLLAISMAATVIQIVKLLPFVIFATPLILALIVELALLADKSTRDRIRNGDTPARPFLPELVVLPAAAATIAGLLVWSGQYFDFVNRNPGPTFDGSDAPALLEEAIVDPLATLDAVEGFPAASDHRESSIECLDQDSPDEEWSEHSIVYWFDEKTATSGPGADAVEAMRDHLQENGWEITNDETIEPGHGITAEREDGVWIEFQVADDTTLLAVHSGCVPDHLPSQLGF